MGESHQFNVYLYPKVPKLPEVRGVMSISKVPGTSKEDDPNQRWFFDFGNQLSSLNPFSQVNWRDFTLIRIQWEYSPYKGSCELDLAFFGLSMVITYVYDRTFTDELMDTKNQIMAELEGRTGLPVVDPTGALDRLENDAGASVPEGRGVT